MNKKTLNAIMRIIHKQGFAEYTQYVAYLRNLAADHRKSGTEYTADDYDRMADLIEALWKNL